MQIAETFRIDEIDSSTSLSRVDSAMAESNQCADSSCRDDTMEQTLEMLRGLNRPGLREMFRCQSAPDLETIRGEYKAELLDQGGRTAQRVTRLLFGLHGKWLGKAFHPISNRRGVGYNTFERAGESVPKIPMDTYLAPSTFESGDSMIIRYDGRHFGPIRWLVGELRQVVPGVLLGIGLYGPSFGRTGRKDRSRRKIPFMLYGPQRPYQIEVEKIDDETTILSGRLKLS